MIGNRYRLESILERTSSFNDGSQILQSIEQELDAELRQSRDILIVGVHLSSRLSRHYSLLNEKLEQGDNIRILIIDPESTACAMSAMRYSRKYSADQERMNIRSTLDSLCNLQEGSSQNLQIRTIDYLFGYGAYCFNLNTRDGVMYITQYTFKKPLGIRNPKSIYRRNDGEQYEFIRAELDTLWENGIPWNCL